MLESLKFLFLDVIVQDVSPQDIISVNIWAILISLANLLILFFIIKKFLFKPVKKMLDARQNAIDKDYQQAKDAVNDANKKQVEVNKKLADINQTANDIIKKAEENAFARGNTIIEEANQKASRIIDQAVDEAELEKKAAFAQMKKNVSEVSIAITEKMLQREVSAEDHRALIDSFINEVGEKDGTEE